MKTSKEIRQAFLDFFAERGHKIVPSAPVVPQGDPTLMFANAGMNQFKDVFLGTGTRPYSRAADTQKCIRVSGKHNDIEEVGVDTYHHTFFEMLGNWSFGDYFKKEAITWSWQFLVDEMGLPAERLWATVFGGEKTLGLDADKEAEDLWPEVTGIPPERVLRFGTKDNFWEMADVGPCGPCSEVHLDLGPDACDMKDIPGHQCGVNGDCGRFIEIWNLVFIQYNRIDATTLKPLPARHVDTGMGFERLCAVAQGVTSNYDTDLFQPLLKRIGERTGHVYGERHKEDVAMRVVADHIRALTMAIADGALPGNKDRGYVLRRLLRRALRFGYQVLGKKEPFIHELVPTVCEVLGETFPEIVARADHIERVVLSEEESFLRTLERGVQRFETIATSLEADKKTSIDGQVAFDLYSTYGFPKDLIELMARERRLALDETSWQRAAEEHKKASSSTKQQLFDPAELEGLPPTTFVGYWDQDGSDDLGVTSKARLVKLIGNEFLILDRTPFYAESGGQVGDLGLIEAPGFRFRVTDTGRMGDIWIHRGNLEEANLSALPETVIARVDRDRRLAIMANHTATHLLHWALHRNVSKQANQQGSLVHPEYLRFDFTHDKALTDQEIRRIELDVNEKIAEDDALDIRIQDYDEAVKDGVTALFGEKYGDRVRVVRAGDYSAELCGGTHCQRTGQIGFFQIVTERAVSAGVRRIVAKTRQASVLASIEHRALLADLAKKLNTSVSDLPRRLDQIQKKLSDLKKAGTKAQAFDAQTRRKALLEKAEPVGQTKIIVADVSDLNPKQIGDLADAIRGGTQQVAGLLAGANGDKVMLVAFASKDLTTKVHAGKLVGEAATLVAGRGGGRPDFAKGGGKDVDNLPKALDRAAEILRAALS
ncbi:MAG: alanine--tRNA ligase [Deltaproteobacteria bacterium]|nr:alanine--tRNA ligase [Deltaproteobacteria bacterium]